MIKVKLNYFHAGYFQCVAKNDIIKPWQKEKPHLKTGLGRSEWTKAI